jgi:hypothetical protein
VPILNGMAHFNRRGKGGRSALWVIEILPALNIISSLNLISSFGQSHEVWTWMWPH